MITVDGFQFLDLSWEQFQRRQISIEILHHGLGSGMPTSSCNKSGFQSLGFVEWPVVKNLGITVVLLKFLSIDIELHVVEIVEQDRITVPFVIANFWARPSP